MASSSCSDENPLANTTNTTDTDTNLLQWCLDNGVIAPKLRIEGKGVHRGLIAIEPIYPSETLLTIPSSLLISRSKCLCDPLLERVYKEQARLFDHQEDAVLAVFLAFHKAVLGEKSTWWTYLKCLPSIEVISDWEEEDLFELQDAALAELARQRRDESHQLAISIVTKLCLSYPRLFPTEVFTESLFLWAYKNVASRGFGSRVDEVQLVPLADMFNHSNESRTKYELFQVPTRLNDCGSNNGGEGDKVEVEVEEKEKDVKTTSLLRKDFDGHSVPYENNDSNSSKETLFRMYATGESSGYAAGDMVTFSYGRRDNAHLLMEYGFALGENEHETLSLVKPPRSLQTLSHEAKEVLHNEQYVNAPFQLFSGRLDAHLLSYFRAISLSQSAESYTRWEKGGIRSLNHPFSVEGEQLALSLYAEYLREVLSTSFPTSIEEDESRLKEVQPGSRISLALQYRLEKKYLLQRHVLLSTNRLKELNAVIASHSMITDMTALESLPALFGARKKSEGKKATFLNINDHDNNEEEEDVGGFKLSDLSGKSSDNDNDDD